MKKVTALTAMLLMAPAFATERGPAIPDYPADQVANNTYVIHGPKGYPSPENQGFMNNPAFVVTDEGVVVIDPGSSVQTGEMVLRQIREITEAPVVALLNTHVHGDHWLGNHAFRNADPQVPIYGHPNMIKGVEEGAGEQWIDIMHRSTEGATAGTEIRGPNIAVGDGDAVSFGDTTFRFHHPGPAHTTTDIMIEIPEKKVLFLADNVCNERIVGMNDGTFRGSVEVIDAALQIPAEVYVPGHGQTAGVEFVHDYRGYLDGVYSGAEEFYEQGMEPFEMKPLIEKRLARFKNWTGFNEELGKHISLAVLEAEQAMFE
ncbi:MBL fold metallo-hydrolase [Thiohalomonas denitrificans]|uniref:Glyoxylase, beta-lactamase superfamily II n=1 Tax=Thiohalomonas denitrificans TaxID=415747 RepID=A0A1G5PQH5_9GAMM|nr:MBL fold metallo-hydrolase [Thiohalomonas denitrificans]SCZ51703.1 Glyoxylase, beta-lactamase superfamily II [Thiohalomonas denitrificans]